MAGLMRAPGDAGAAPGPDGSMQQGKVAQTTDLARSLKSSSPAAYAATQGAPPPGGAPGGSPPGTPSPAAGGPPSSQGQAQPPPFTIAPDKPPGKFSPQDPKTLQMPWRRSLRMWASHPDAGPMLKIMGHLSKMDQVPPHKQGGQPPQG